MVNQQTTHQWIHSLLPPDNLYSFYRGGGGKLIFSYKNSYSVNFLQKVDWNGEADVFAIRNKFVLNRNEVCKWRKQ